MLFRYLDICRLPGKVCGAADLLPAVTRGHVDSQDTRAHVRQRHGDLGDVGPLTGLGIFTCFISIIHVQVSLQERSMIILSL